MKNDIWKMAFLCLVADLPFSVSYLADSPRCGIALELLPFRFPRENVFIGHDNYRKQRHFAA